MSNSELRKRKNKEHNERPKTSKKRKDKTVSSIQTSLLCLILSGTILTLFIILYTDQIPWHIGNRALDSIAKKLGYHKPVHAVVLDAGSTGSRVTAFTFHESYLNGHLVLDKELFVHTKPGLSSFAKEPEKGIATLEGLLAQAKEEIPQEYWSRTPLILKATAGLRLLPVEQAEGLLRSVKEYFKKTPFLTNDKSVEIMDGVDEGIFSWFTVNFLLEKINGNPANTVAALDLGGGSTQVTFSAITPASLKEKQYIHQAASPRGPIPVYTQSFLGLGLMAARHAIVTLNQPDATTVTSECVNPIIKNKKFHYGGILRYAQLPPKVWLIKGLADRWRRAARGSKIENKFEQRRHVEQGTDFFVSGLQENYPTSHIKGTDFQLGEVEPIVSFYNCSQIITKYVESKAKPPEELPLKTIFAFSYYFDRAIDVGLIDESTGGQIKVKDFKKAAEQSCHEANAEQPFMCLDLTFIWVLLEKGFGLKEDSKIFLYKKIDGHEISWALGAAYNLLRG